MNAPVLLSSVAKAEKPEERGLNGEKRTQVQMQPDVRGEVYDVHGKPEVFLASWRNSRKSCESRCFFSPQSWRG